MLFIPGKLIALLTFPGVIVHELGHLFFCRLTNTKVRAYCLYQFDEPAGFVVHEKPKSLFNNFLICFGPFFVNTVLAVAVILVGTLFAWLSGVLGLLFLWLSLSIGMHAFPSKGDGISLYNQTGESIRKGNWLSVIYLPFVLLVYVASLLSIFWADLLYAIAVVYGFISLLGIPFFYLTQGGVEIDFKKGEYSIIGGQIYFDGHPLGEYTEKMCSKYSCHFFIPQKFVSNNRTHVLRYITDKCREWNLKDPEIKRGKLVLDYNAGKLVDFGKCGLDYLNAGGDLIVGRLAINSTSNETSEES